MDDLPTVMLGDRFMFWDQRVPGEFPRAATIRTDGSIEIKTQNPEQTIRLTPTQAGMLVRMWREIREQQERLGLVS